MVPEVPQSEFDQVFVATQMIQHLEWTVDPVEPPSFALLRSPHRRQFLELTQPHMTMFPILARQALL